MYSRRDFGKVALSAFPFAAAVAAKIDSKIHGVQIGAQTYSFRDLTLGGAIDAMKTLGLGQCELFTGHVEPDLGRESLREWRLATPWDYFRSVRKKFDEAGIRPYAYTLNFKDDFTDEELDRGFQMTKALGTNLITTSTTLTCAPRLAPLARKYKVRVALHGHDETSKPNEFSTPGTFAQGLAMSPHFYINLDIGHFFAAGFDPVAYIRENHTKILALHIKDRKSNHGPNMPFGEGETPVKEVLRLMRDQKYPFPADIEYEYGKQGMDTVAEVKKCFEYCKEALG